MSCKILAHTDHCLAQPMKWRDLPGEPIPPMQGARDVAAPKDTGEISRLHGRVVELERALELEVRQAAERAFHEGQKAGHDAAAAEMHPVMERLVRSCSEIASLRPRIRRETEADMVTLTLAIARRVLRRELSVDPEAIHGVVKAAMEKVQAKEITAIRSNPEHVAPIRSFFEKTGLSAGVEIVADPALPPGGVVIETKRGNLDASVETQLKEIERGFADRLQN